MKKILLLLSLALVTLSFSLAQTPHPVIKRDLSIDLRFSQEALQQPIPQASSEVLTGPPEVHRSGVDPALASLLQAVLDSQQVSRNLKGLSAALTLPNGDTWKGASGLSSATDSVRPDMLFGVGSVTKTFVAACILQLYEEGQLHLEDSLFTYLASYPNIDSTISIRQLLNHTSGIYNCTDHPDFADSMNANLGRVWTPEEVLLRFVDSAYFPKGVSWAYSNTNFVLLGMIIEQVTGNSVGNEIRSRFLSPLGIARTYYWPWEPLQGPAVHLWADIGTGSLLDITALGLPLRALWSAVGAAGAYHSTAENLALWAHALYGGEVLADTTLQEMLTTVPLLPGFGYGLGVIEASILGRTCYGHAGDIIFAAQMYYSPTDTVSVSVLTNHGTASSTDLEPIVIALFDAYLNFQPPSTPLDPALERLEARVYPNPFSSKLYFELEQPGPSSLQIFDLQGKRVTYLESASGTSLSWDGKTETGIPAPAGCYLYVLSASGKEARGKVIRHSE